MYKAHKQKNKSTPLIFTVEDCFIGFGRLTKVGWPIFALIYLILVIYGDCRNFSDGDTVMILLLYPISHYKTFPRISQSFEVAQSLA